MCVVSRRLHTTHFFKPSALLCAEAGPPVVWGGCFPLVSFASGAPWFDCFRSSFVRFLSSFRATLASSLAFASSGVTGAFCMRFEAFISALKFFKAFFVFLCLSSFRSCFFFCRLGLLFSFLFLQFKFLFLQFSLLLLSLLLLPFYIDDDRRKLHQIAPALCDGS